MYKPGDRVWVSVAAGRGRIAAIIHSKLSDDWWALVNVEGMPTRPGRKGWRAQEHRITPRTFNRPGIHIDNLRLSFVSLTPKEQPTMIDKSKPFYIVRTPEFGTGAHYTPARGPFPAREVPELWRAKQSKDEAIVMAMTAGAHGKQFDVFELRLVGSTQPPQAVWLPAKKPRKAKRSRKGRK